MHFLAQFFLDLMFVNNEIMLACLTNKFRLSREIEGIFMSKLNTILLSIWVAMLTSCGAENQEYNLNRQAEPSISKSFNGYAVCVAEPNLIIRNLPNQNATVSANKPNCSFGEKAWVEAVIKGDDSRFYARLPGWGNHNINGKTYGYANILWLEAAKSGKEETHDDNICSTKYDNSYAVAPVAQATRAVLSVVGYAEGTGNCYNYMFGYKNLYMTDCSVST